MDAKDHNESDLAKSSICRLEWIAWAMEAARRHKETEQLAGPQPTTDADGEAEDDDADPVGQ